MIRYGSEAQYEATAGKPVELAHTLVAKAKALPLATLDQSGAFGRPIVVPALVVEAGPRALKLFANIFGSIANDKHNLEHYLDAY